MNRKVILFEMNEVPYRVLDDFARRHPHSAVARLMVRSKQLETVCEDQIELDPWSAWPTLHRGVTDQEHGVRHLGQSLESANRCFPPLWEILARHGRSVGVFGSLHSSALPAAPERYAFYLPDCFAEHGFAHPPRLRAFQELNLLMTRRSARNVDRAIPLRAAAAFLRDYLRNGFDRGTAATVLRALAAERANPERKSRRRSLQPLIGLDLFLPLVRRAQPELATFHTNHVAANLHRFWAAAFPEDVSAPPMPPEWCRRYAGEIEYSMQVLDRMLGRLRSCADAHDYLLLAASGIGQAGVPAERTCGFVTITDLGRFMSRMGVAAGAWQRKPAMVPCLTVSVAPASADGFEARLKSLSIGGHRVRRARREGSAPFSFDRSENGAFHFYVYFDELDMARLEPSVGDRRVAPADLGLGFFRQEEGVACSGRHTPFGVLLVYDPRRRAGAAPRGVISTLEIAPALLENFGIAVPSYMAAHDPGLLDVTSSAPNAAERFHGGGVETPVVVRAAPPQIAAA